MRPSDFLTVLPVSPLLCAEHEPVHSENIFDNHIAVPSRVPSKLNSAVSLPPCQSIISLILQAPFVPVAGCDAELPTCLTWQTLFGLHKVSPVFVPRPADQSCVPHNTNDLDAAGAAAAPGFTLPVEGTNPCPSPFSFAYGMLPELLLVVFVQLLIYIRRSPSFLYVERFYINERRRAHTRRDVVRLVNSVSSAGVDLVHMLGLHCDMQEGRREYIERRANKM